MFFRILNDIFTIFVVSSVVVVVIIIVIIIIILRSTIEIAIPVVSIVIWAEANRSRWTILPTVMWMKAAKTWILKKWVSTVVVCIKINTNVTQSVSKLLKVKKT